MPFRDFKGTSPVDYQDRHNWCVTSLMEKEKGKSREAASKKERHRGQNQIRREGTWSFTVGRQTGGVCYYIFVVGGRRRKSRKVEGNRTTSTGTFETEESGGIKKTRERPQLRKGSCIVGCRGRGLPQRLSTKGLVLDPERGVNRDGI